MSKREKTAYEKIRKVWEINPRTRVKVDEVYDCDCCKYCRKMGLEECNNCDKVQLGNI